MLKKFVLIALFVFITSAIHAETVPPQELADENGAFVEIDGFDIYYIDMGETDAPTVILLHGFGGSTFTWRDSMTTLVDAGYRVVAYDRPPFGLSQKSRDIPLTGTAQADQLAGLMDALEIETATLVGHSAGAGVISYFATLHADRVDGLVFVAGAVAIPRDEDSETANGESGSGAGGLFSMAGNIDFDNPAAATVIRTLLTPDRFVSILASAYAPAFNVTEEVEDGYARVLQVDDWEQGFIAIFANQETGEPLDIDALAAVGAEVPVAIIWGEIDTWVPLSRGEALNALIPSAMLITYAGVGHMPMEENVTGFNADLIAFLAEVYESEN